jgi:prepilin-type N-terminal cleavage/methylation domain-containing protein
VTRKPGVTLVELLVVLAVLALAAGVVGLTLRTARPIDREDPIKLVVEQARDSAIAAGHGVTITVLGEMGRSAVTSFPDGRVEADHSLGIDELSGAARANR